MPDPVVNVGASQVDSEKLSAELEMAAADKRSRGVYAAGHIAAFENAASGEARDEDEFLSSYLDRLHDAVIVDISDFEIHERRSWFVRLFVGIKRCIWNLLKFYTYRLWSQQNQANGLLVGAIEEVDGRNRRKIAELEERIARLEGNPEQAEAKDA